jgi:hypothetical protein
MKTPAKNFRLPSGEPSTKPDSRLNQCAKNSGHYQLNKHSSRNGSDKFVRLRRGETCSLEPIGKRKDAAGLQMPRCIQKSFSAVIVVGDRFDRPCTKRIHSVLRTPIGSTRDAR